MAVNDSLNGGQSYSGALKLFSQMQTLKDAEQLVYVLHVKAGAIVPHEHLDFFIAVHTANLDFGRLSHACEFDRVGNKVDNDQPQHGPISVADRKRADLPGNVSPLRVLPDFRDHLLDELLQFDLRRSGLGPADP